MAKVEHCIKLVGCTNDLKPARIGADVRCFVGKEGRVLLRKTKTGDVTVTTQKGKYVLKAHPSIENMFTGVLADGIKCRFSKKKITAKLVYWA